MKLKILDHIVYLNRSISLWNCLGWTKL